MKNALKLSNVLCIVMTFASGAAAFAQAWPTKPLTLVVTFSAGSPSDIVARLIAGPLQAKLGQPVIVDNRPGAGGTTGAAITAKAAPDGYSLLLSETAAISISPFMLTKPTYDPVNDFSHVSYIGSIANVFVAHPSVPAKNLPELVTWIRAGPDPVNYGSAGVGSIGHAVGETFKKMYGLKLQHASYTGSSQMRNDLLAGNIKLAIDTLPQNVPFMRDGTLRALAVTSPGRAVLAPDVPGGREFGRNLVAENFLGISGPAGLSPAVVARLHAAMSMVLADPVVASRLTELGVAGYPMAPADFRAFVQNQVKQWAPVAKALGAQLQ